MKYLILILPLMLSGCNDSLSSKEITHGFYTCSDSKGMPFTMNLPGRKAVRYGDEVKFVLTDFSKGNLRGGDYALEYEANISDTEYHSFSLYFYHKNFLDRIKGAFKLDFSKYIVNGTLTDVINFKAKARMGKCEFSPFD